jgi:hypothetical protein
MYYYHAGRQWIASDQDGAAYVGMLEFQDCKGEWHNFYVLSIVDRLLFGGATNTGFMESGYILKDGELTEDVLPELLADLETYYNEGPQYVSRIVCNQRM